MRFAAGSNSLLLGILLVAPSCWAAEPVVVGAPELLVDETVELGMPGVGRDYITWVDQRPLTGTTNNNVFVQFHPGQATYALTETFESESHQAADGPWVAFARPVTAEPKQGEPRPRPTDDLVVYNVEQKREVYASATRDRNEMMFDIASDRLVFATELIQGNSTLPQRVEIMDLKGSNAFKPRVLRDSGQQLKQLHPTISDTYVAFTEVERADRPNSVHIVAVELATGAHRIVAPAKAGIGYGPLDLEGSRLLYGAYDSATNTSYAVVFDLAANIELGRWAASATDNFRTFDQRGDLLVAEVARELPAKPGEDAKEKRYLFAWCLPDGTPSMLPDAFVQEAEFPALTSWGTVVYLRPAYQTVYIYQRPIGCGSLPAVAKEGGFLPAVDGSFAVLGVLAAAFVLGRRRP